MAKQVNLLPTVIDFINYSDVHSKYLTFSLRTLLLRGSDAGTERFIPVLEAQCRKKTAVVEIVKPRNQNNNNF